MAFDITTAKPATAGFDISTAQPQPPAAQPAQEQPIRQTPLNPVIAEAVGALNRGVAEIPDFAIRAFNQLLGGITEVTGLETAKLPSTLELAETVIGEPVGQRGFMQPGTARDVVQKVGEFVPAVAGVVAGARTAAGKVGQAVLEQGQIEATRVAAGKGAGETGVVRKTLTESGLEAVSDPKAKEAIRQGFGEGVVAQVKAATTKTKQQMRRMVGITQRGLTNESFRGANRPADIAGDAVASRIRGLTQINKRAGQGISREAKKLSGQRVDFGAAGAKLADDFEEIGIRVGDDLKVNLRGSDIEDISGAEQMLNTVIRRVDRLDNNALAGHKLKRFIDEQVSFGKRGEGGLSGTVERVLKGLRKNIDDTLDLNFPAYKKQNEIFAETRQVLDDFQDAGGKSINFKSENVAKQIGTLSRRIFSNVTSRVKLTDSLEGLESVAAKHGIDTSDDIAALARFADELDVVFKKPAARTSLTAEVAKAQVTQGTSGTLTKLAEAAFDKVARINDPNKIKAIREVLLP